MTGKIEKRIAVVQSNYIPWRGYFDLIASVDEFVIYDCVQFTKRDWRNRNLILTPSGTSLLTVPVQTKGRFDQNIQDVLIDGDKWADAHRRAFHLNYSRAKYYSEIWAGVLAESYGSKHAYLSTLNTALIQSICKYLGIKTVIRQSSEFVINGTSSQKLLDICLQSGASQYVSGPAATSYLDVNLFVESGVEVRWFRYPNYARYPQLWSGCDVQLSIVDLLFNCGRQSRELFRAGVVSNE